MSNSNENPNDANSRGERESVPADFDCPDVAPIESFDGNVEAPLPVDFGAMANADERGRLDGYTNDGLSAVFLSGSYRFVTPCHTAEVGLRASKICPACHGNLDKPVETAQPLPCGHYAVVTHATGDRVTPCPTCGTPALVRAEQVIVTRYLAREMTQPEQLRLMGMQTP